MAEAIDLPETEEILMLMDLGYAAEGAGPLPNHSSRKPLAETVSFLYIQFPLRQVPRGF